MLLTVLHWVLTQFQSCCCQLRMSLTAQTHQCIAISIQLVIGHQLDFAFAVLPPPPKTYKP